MVNKALFQSTRGKLVPQADTTNAAGGAAYALSPKHALTQMALTGTFGNTFYTGAGEQLETMLQLADQVEPEYLAKLALYARKKGYMKDTPAFLVAVLSSKGPEYFGRVFETIITDGRMLRNFAQMIRSGVTGRKSFGTRPKKLMQQWLQTASVKQLLNASIGNDPSLNDIIKMVHPKAAESWREAFFAWAVGKTYNEEALPDELKAFKAFVADSTNPVPDVPFQMLTAQPLTKEHWTKIMRNMTWTQLRMNINTLTRNGVFEDADNVQYVASRLQDSAEVARAQVFPYQLLTTYQAVSTLDVPMAIKLALQDAMEHATSNIPTISGSVAVCMDVSGSMTSPVTGSRGTKDTATRCIDVAGLVVSALLRKNEHILPVAFDDNVYDPNSLGLNPRDSVMTNAQRLASINGGSTNCAAPILVLNQMGLSAKYNTVLMVSDNESWITDRNYDLGGGYSSGRGTELARAWEQYRSQNPEAVLICLDVNPHANTQIKEQPGVYNIGGFSDNVFELIAQIAEGKASTDFLVGEVEKVEL